ncbi:MAG TPA: hypothetical protein VGZ47_06415 [Gemmataceae bacterium]|jgi:hypothetical protein|nr:hypothetical protein [Gemmataceae bacterium]
MRYEWFLVFLAFAFVVWVMPARGDDPQIKEGSKLPTIELPAANVGKALPDQKDAKTLNLKEFEGKKNVVLFFFPKAMTKG